MLKKLYLLVALVILMISVGGCKYFQSSGEDTITGEVIQIGDANKTVTEEPNKTIEKEPPKPETPEIIPEGIVRIEKTEGDLITLRPDAYDPDGDTIMYKFTTPFDENGKWQTKEGDAGNYKITITASDGKLSTTEDVLVVVRPTNKAPVINCPDEITVKETETVKLNCNITDPEGEEVIIKYTGWMSSSTKKTTYNDEGEYETTISGSDKNRTTEKTIKIIVENLNRAPVVQDIKDIKIEETETAKVDMVANDLDGDKLTYTYGKPLNDKGAWETKMDDAGTYDSYVVISDGEGSVRKEFKIIVSQKNTAPKLTYIEPITVSEGDTITLPINAIDREGDKLQVTVNGWFNTKSYNTTYDDAGEHTVTITVSDGKLSTSQEVEITVIDKNRPPVFKVPA